MSTNSPIQKAYRQCGFHNRTLAELRSDSNLLRGAILDDEKENTAHVPNIFGTFIHDGITYNTVLTIIGIDDPYEKQIIEKPSRGFSWHSFENISDNQILWHFFILMDKKFCHEELFQNCRDNDVSLIKYCGSLCDRTDIFATEFLCNYYFFLETVLEVYARGNCQVAELPVRESSRHPSKEDKENLICSYEDISKMLKWFSEKYDLGEWDFSSIQSFLGLHLGRTRKALLPYYHQWLINHRVNSEIVEKRTLEFISMNFIQTTYDN